MIPKSAVLEIFNLSIGSIEITVQQYLKQMEASFNLLIEIIEGIGTLVNQRWMSIAENVFRFLTIRIIGKLSPPNRGRGFLRIILIKENSRIEFKNKKGRLRYGTFPF